MDPSPRLYHQLLKAPDTARNTFLWRPFVQHSRYIAHHRETPDLINIHNTRRALPHSYDTDEPT